MVKKHFTMHRRQFEADWERRKKYLLRSMFADPPVLSPIPEIRESRSRSLSPRPVVTVSSANRASPLPELIVERVRSNENLEVTEHDEFGQMGNKPEDDVDKENENKISDMSEDKNQTDSSNCNEILNETAGIENSDDSKHQSDTRGEDSDEIQKSIEKCGETQASSDSDTFVISPRRVASEPVEKRNIDKLAELEGINNEEHSNDSSYYEHNEEEEENVNEENSSESFGNLHC
ncbi:AP-3 complex subunit beta-1-like [Pectinophora gossypiella]|uniref:AP-3 complex subunit beta-1-like n=1 Tax=Pectinophora gossypiella TaxID=13191 RepID=UPI00214EDC1B|nr:AP-3 complex subunit beta-1-like [Pectinophora gossypiella]